MPGSVSFLLADENVPDGIVKSLRSKGHDVVRVRDLCKDKSGDGTSDYDVLVAATLQGRAVVTLNAKDFRALHSEYPGHKGILTFRHSQNFKKTAKQIDNAIRQLKREKKPLDGQLIRIPYEPEDDSRPIPLRG